ncbi:hypothetical protein BH24ACT15_BH24ACT15_29940 [soil metagenome]
MNDYTETLTDLGLKVTFPDGTGFYYVDESHAYYRAKPEGGRGKRLTSVSSLVKPFDFKPDNLMRWAAKQTCAGVVLLDKPDGWAADADKIWDTLTESKLTFNDLREAKATTGTLVHAAFESLANGFDVDLEEFAEADQGYVLSVLEWWAREQPEVLNVEQFVYSEEHGFTGRFDLRAVRRASGSPTLIDLKTSGYIGTAYHVQLAGYALAAEECGVGGCGDTMILKAHEDGRVATEVEGLATAQDFLHALAVYRSAGEIERGTRRAKATEGATA